MDETTTTLTTTTKRDARKRKVIRFSAFAGVAATILTAAVPQIRGETWVALLNELGAFFDALAGAL